MAGPDATEVLLLHSPGAALTERHTLEEELTALALESLATFLDGVGQDARAALKAPVLLAAAAGSTPAPFSLGSVLSRWQPVTKTLAGALGPRLDIATGDLYLAAAEQRLLKSDLPSEVYNSVRAVLSTSLEKSWTPRQTQLQLAEVLKSGTPSAMVTSEGLATEGTSWEGMARRIARTEATGATSYGRLARMARAGVPRKRWASHHDKNTRLTHRNADGQTVALTASFIVGGFAMMAPGDPAAPTELTANCRCSIVAAN